MHMKSWQLAVFPRFVGVMVWVLVLASVGYWTQAVLSGHGRPGGATLPAVLQANITSPVDLARLLGASSAPSATQRPPLERWALVGLIADGNGQGAALISVDGKPARAFSVGAELAPGSVLLAVGSKEAQIADDLQSPARTILQLSAQPAPASARDALVPRAPLAGVPPSTAAAPAPEEATPTGPPPRADSRRQPPASLRREDRRGP